MNKLRLGVIAVVVVTATALFPAPASAHAYAGYGVFAGTFSIGGGACGNGGALLPANPLCPLVILPPLNWSLSSTTVDVILSSEVLVSTGANRILGGGPLSAWCGGGVGSGTVSFDGHVASAVTLVWAGNTVHLESTVVDGHAGVFKATFDVQPLPGSGPSEVPCGTAGATNFAAVGEAMASSI